MLIVERQSKLLAIVQERKTAELDELAKLLGVSVSTVRRDLEALESKKLIQRTHGGAVYIEQTNTKPGGLAYALTARLSDRIKQKTAIGQFAASLVQPHMTLLLDGGSSVIFAAQQITVRPIQVVTTSLHVAQLFADDDQVELTLIGGQLYPRTGVVVGTLARQCLSELYADLCFISLAGIDDQAAYNINLEMARVEQLMMKQAGETLMLMDSSKFGRKSLVRVCEVDQIDCVVTDAGVDPIWPEKLGDRLVVAK